MTGKGYALFSDNPSIIRGKPDVVRGIHKTPSLLGIVLSDPLHQASTVGSPGPRLHRPAVRQGRRSEGRGSPSWCRPVVRQVRKSTSPRIGMPCTGQDWYRGSCRECDPQKGVKTGMRPDAARSRTDRRTGGVYPGLSAQKTVYRSRPSCRGNQNLRDLPRSRCIRPYTDSTCRTGGRKTTSVLLHVILKGKSVSESAIRRRDRYVSSAGLL